MNVKIADWLEKAVIIILIGIVAWLVLLAGFSTSFLDIEQKTFMVKDSIVINWFAFALLVVLLNIVDKVLKDRFIRYAKIISYVLYAVMIIIALLVVLTLPSGPIGDQGAVFGIAKSWASGDFESTFAQGGYFDRYPQQQGIIILLYFFIKIFGIHAVIAYRLVNTLMLVAMYAVMCRYIEQHYSVRAKIMLQILCCVFIPPILYTTFVYGNIISTSLCAISIINLLDYRDYAKTSNIVMALIAACLAIFIRGTSFIFVFAEFVYWLLITIKKFELRKAFIALALILVLVSTNKIVDITTYSISGLHAGKGMASESWIAEGLIEQPDRRYDGWYNGYAANTYAESGFNHDEHKKIAHEFLSERVNDFKHDPKHAVKFFTGKNASQWNNPTFDCFWINQFMYRYDEQPHAGSDRLLYEPHVYNISKLLNYLQFMILMLSMIGLVIEFKNPENIVLFAIVFIGGFLFHSIWEANPQNTLWYYVFFMPIAAIGCTNLCEINSIKKARVQGIVLGTFLIVSVLVAVISNGFTRNLIKRDNDTEEYNSYIEETTKLTKEEQMIFYHQRD
ncbi:Alg9-like mannosyltransferase family protein [Pseudobutyrivibrio sp. C4]|uniref:hypothetical protein n=1 Tax=Pseudobutyrivibrio sp. C4 TaxID=1520803 RepID=UPI0008B3413D|nr:hypothetical protein [Pseudobutyrivibrio sp. C4]SET24974.1 Alg9-like mannosyltransferase family protein [Pseudobutyrivibrio sp. C4]